MNQRLKEYQEHILVRALALQSFFSDNHPGHGQAAMKEAFFNQRASHSDFARASHLSIVQNLGVHI